MFYIWGTLFTTSWTADVFVLTKMNVVLFPHIKIQMFNSNLEICIKKRNMRPSVKYSIYVNYRYKC